MVRSRNVVMALELDADDKLILLGRRALGADPRDVADTLARIRYTRRPTG